MQYANESIFASPYTQMYSSRMTIGDRLDRAMKAAKIESQSELARRSGVPQATISRILKGGGKKGPETETVKKLAKALNISFESLNEGGVGIGAPNKEERFHQAEAANDANVTAEEIIELINAYKSMTPTERGILMSSAKAAAKRVANRRGRTTQN
jgi:transcriptional regulator with XRE-family HTH domain